METLNLIFFKSTPLRPFCSTLSLYCRSEITWLKWGRDIYGELQINRNKCGCDMQIRCKKKCSSCCPPLFSGTNPPMAQIKCNWNKFCMPRNWPVSRLGSHEAHATSVFQLHKFIGNEFRDRIGLWYQVHVLSVASPIQTAKQPTPPSPTYISSRWAFRFAWLAQFKVLIVA